MPRSSKKSPSICAAFRAPHGGWPLFRDGEFDMSATVKAYFALKMIGDEPQAPHMHRAREAIRLRGGAERANVFTRCLLALYGIVPWRAVPEMPVEIMLLPRWFPFHLDKISYWSRTVIVPLLVLMAKKPRARESPKASPSTNCSSNRRSRSGRRRRRRSRRRRGSGSSAASTMCCAPRSRCFRSARGRAPSIAPSPGSASGSTARTGSARFSRRWPTA